MVVQREVMARKHPASSTSRHDSKSVNSISTVVAVCFGGEQTDSNRGRLFECLQNETQTRTPVWLALKRDPNWDARFHRHPNAIKPGGSGFGASQTRRNWHFSLVGIKTRPNSPARRGLFSRQRGMWTHRSERRGTSSASHGNHEPRTGKYVANRCSSIASG